MSSVNVKRLVGDSLDLSEGSTVAFQSSKSTVVRLAPLLPENMS